MTEETNITQPAHCFCHFGNDELKPWVDKKFHEHLSTMELLKSTDDPHQKEIISAVALLDVDEETMLKMMGGVDMPKHHIVHCRENVKQMLGLD